MECPASAKCPWPWTARTCAREAGRQGKAHDGGAVELAAWFWDRSRSAKTNEIPGVVATARPRRPHRHHRRHARPARNRALPDRRLQGVVTAVQSADHSRDLAAIDWRAARWSGDATTKAAASRPDAARPRSDHAEMARPVRSGPGRRCAEANASWSRWAGSPARSRSASSLGADEAGPEELLNLEPLARVRDFTCRCRASVRNLPRNLAVEQRRHLHCARARRQHSPGHSHYAARPPDAILTAGQPCNGPFPKAAVRRSAAGRCGQPSDGQLEPLHNTPRTSSDHPRHATASSAPLAGSKTLRSMPAVPIPVLTTPDFWIGLTYVGCLWKTERCGGIVVPP